MKIRIKFSKNGVIQYVGHLDLMRFFQKAVTRAKLPVSYSAGFNPHQIMSFALPLGIGICSDSEYMDMELNEYVPKEDIVEKLNSQMVEGISIIDAAYLDDKAKKSMSLVSACAYTITPKSENHDLSVLLNWSDCDELPFLKKTKKSENIINIKPLIYSFDLINNTIQTVIASGSTSNLKPAELIHVLTEKFCTDLSENDFYYRRNEIYAKDENENLTPLLEFTGV